MPPDPWSLLLQKGLDDERLAALAAGEATIADEQIGFLAQQAIEKAIKAVLSFHTISYRRTHDLGELISLLKEADIACPDAIDECIAFTPFAEQMRYDYLPTEEDDDEPFDRRGALQLVRIMLA